jgi:hypothetical protein
MRDEKGESTCGVSGQAGALYVHRDTCELEESGRHSYVMLLVICNVYTFVCRCAEQRQRTRVEPN